MEVKLGFPLARSAGNLYFAHRDFPHGKTWVGQAAGQVTLQMQEDQLLGLAFSYDFNDKDAPKVEEALKLLKSADFSMGTFHSSVLAILDACPLREMRLDFATLSQDDLTRIGANQTVETLWLTGSSIRDEQLSKLAGMSALTSLALKNTSIGAEGLKHLTGYKTLKRLHLPSVINDGALAVLKDCAVEELDLSYSQVSDAGIAVLSQMPSLTTVYLNDTTLTDAALPHLAKSATIKVIFLNGTRIGDSALSALADMSQLEHLELRDTHVTELGAQRLKSKLKDCAIFN